MKYTANIPHTNQLFHRIVNDLSVKYRIVLEISSDAQLRCINSDRLL
jgi:hypothetical protein